METMRRCGFFFDVFGLELPEYLTCKLFADSINPDECVGNKEMRELKTRKPGKLTKQIHNEKSINEFFKQYIRLDAQYVHHFKKLL